MISWSLIDDEWGFIDMYIYRVLMMINPWLTVIDLWSMMMNQLLKIHILWIQAQSTVDSCWIMADQNYVDSWWLLEWISPGELGSSEFMIGG